MAEEIHQRIDHLNQQVLQLYQANQYEQAVEKIRIAYNAGYVPVPFPALDALAQACIQKGDYALAEPLISRSIEFRRQLYSEEDPAVLEPLITKALVANKLGKIEAAREIFEQILQTRRRVLSKDHPDLIASLDDLAHFYYEQGNPNAAEPLLRESIEIHLRVSDREDPTIIKDLSMLTEIYATRGETLQAESLLREALDILRKTLGEYHPDLIEILTNLSVLYINTQNHAAAEWTNTYILKLVHRAVGEKHPLYATSLERLAHLKCHMSQYKLAEPLYLQALQIRREVLGENSSEVVKTIKQLVNLYQELGEYAQVELFLQEAIDIQSKATNDHDPSLVAYLLNLGRLYTEIHDHKKAISVFNRTFEILATVDENRLATAALLSSLGHLYHSLGHLSEAEHIYLHALKIRRRVASTDLRSQIPLLSSLGALYEQWGNYTEAHTYLDQALSIGQELHQEKYPDYAIILNNIARLEYAQGDYIEAASNFRQAIVICEANHDISELLKMLYNIAEVYAALDQPNEAMEYMNQATKLENHIISQVFAIGTDSRRMAYLETVYTHMSQILSLIVNSFMESQQMAGAALNLVLQRKALTTDSLATRRDTILEGKYPHLQSQLQNLTFLSSQLALKILAGPGQEEPDIYQQHLEDDTEKVEQLEAELASQIPEMNLEQMLQSTDYQAIAMSIPAEAVLIEFVRFSLFDFKAVRSHGESHWKSGCYLAFVLSAKETTRPRIINLGDADHIDQMISIWRTSITNEEEHRHLSLANHPDQTKSSRTSAGMDLRVAVFDPLLETIQGHERLFIAPDGDLTRLPFEVLPTKNEQYLIDEYQISYLSTGRDLLRFGSATISQSTPPIVVADPDFDLELDSTTPTMTMQETSQQLLPQALRQSRIRFPRLPGTRIEGEHIAKMLGIQPLSGKSALESSLKTCHSPRILHLATHGFFLEYQEPAILNPEDLSPGMILKSADPQLRMMVLNGVVATPIELVDASDEDKFSRLSGHGLKNPMLRSGLALAGANTWLSGKQLPTEAEDAILTAEDVSGMDLLATELVVLSACETGLGEVQISEGVFGLRRAFILAGARTLVMSLWKVPDRQTQELMTDFYQRILAGQSRIEALRAARLAIKAKYPDPYYWGAFICQGDPGIIEPLENFYQ